MRCTSLAAALLVALLLVTAAHASAALDRAFDDVEGHRRDNEAFLAKVAAEPGIHKLDGHGIFFKIIRLSDQHDTVAKNDASVIVVNYKATLRNGTVFDETKPGQPVRATQSSFLKGLQAVLHFMKRGDKFKVYIPPSVAYGAEGKWPVIPPHATLIYVVELVDVEGPTQKHAAQRKYLEMHTKRPYEELYAKHSSSLGGNAEEL